MDLHEGWRLLPFHLGASDDHFARSDSLARLTSPPTVWWHATEQPTLVLGAGQRWNEVQAHRRGTPEMQVVRRHAGGTAVFAGPGLLGLDVAVPARHPLALADVVETYRWLGEVWYQALKHFAVDAHLVTIPEARSAPRPSNLAAACFGSLSPYEVTAQGRKLVGLAQVRRSGRVLLQSAMHLALDAVWLSASLEVDEDALRQAAISLDELAPGVGRDQVIEAWADALTGSLGVQLIDGCWTDAELTHATTVQPRLLLPPQSQEL